MKVINKIINICLYAIVGLLLVTVITSFQTSLLGKSYNNIFGYTLFEIETASMSKTLEIGDWILVKVTKDVDVNDVITYQDGNSFVTHRIIEKYQDSYVTRGDANNAKDAPITKDQIVGKMVQTFPGFGIIKKTLLNPKILFLSLIALLLGYSIFNRENLEQLIHKTIPEKINKIKNPTKEEPKLSKPIKKESIKVEKIVDEKKEEVKPSVSTKTRELSKTVLLSKISVDMDSDNLKVIKSLKEEKEESIESTKKENDSNKKENNESTIKEENVDKTEQSNNDSLKDEGNGEQSTELTPETKEALEKLGINPETLDEEEVQDSESDEFNDENVSDDRILGKGEKNIVDKSIKLIRMELNELMCCLMETTKMESSYKNIFNKFLDNYIEQKYMKQVELFSESTKYSACKKLDNNIIEYGNKLIDESKKKSEKVKIEYVKRQFRILNKILMEEDDISQIIEKSDLLLYKNNKEVSKQIKKVIRNYEVTYKDYLSKIATGKFELTLKEVSNPFETIFNSTLKSNIKINNMFSDYIIDKSYKDKGVVEELSLAKIKLLSCEILKDMHSLAYEKKYLVYLPESLFEKKKKTLSFLSSIQDEYSQSKLYIYIDYNTLMNYHDLINDLKKMGFLFVVEIDPETDDDSKDLTVLCYAEYVVIINAKRNGGFTKNNLPLSISDKIIYCNDSLIEGVRL